MITKKCSSCGIDFPETKEFFYRETRNEKSWYRGKCKKCHNKKRQEKKYSEKVLALKAQLKAELEKEAAAKNALNEKVVCRYCEKETDHVNDKKFCRACEREDYLYQLEVEAFNEKVAQEIAEKNEWITEAKKKTYICRVCGLENSFDNMRLIPSQKRVDKICKPCNKEKKKEYTANYRARQFAGALAKRRELENEQNR